MSFGSHQRQILFFVAAVLLPCAVLVALGVRMIRQERELAEKRAADDRRRIASDIRQQLLAHLERIKSEEASAVAAGKHRVRLGRYQNAEVVLIARIEEGQPVLPWEAAAAGEKGGHFLDQPQFAALIRQGEEQEFLKSAYTNAAARYAEAAQVATHPVQTAHAHLLQARVQARSGEHDQAATLYREVLELALDYTDQQGIPVALYAAAGLIQLGMDHGVVLELVQRLSDARANGLPSMVYLLRPC